MTIFNEYIDYNFCSSFNKTSNTLLTVLVLMLDVGLIYVCNDFFAVHIAFIFVTHGVSNINIQKTAWLISIFIFYRVLDSWILLV